MLSKCQCKANLVNKSGLSKANLVNIRAYARPTYRRCFVRAVRHRGMPPQTRERLCRSIAATDRARPT